MPQFIVTGLTKVAGVEPGGLVELDDPKQIEQLTWGGHVAPVDDYAPEGDDQDPEEG